MQNLELLIVTESLHRDSFNECLNRSLPDIIYGYVESARISARCGGIIVLFDKRKVKCSRLTIRSSELQCVGATLSLQTSDKVMYTVLGFCRPPGHATACFYNEFKNY